MTELAVNPGTATTSYTPLADATNPAKHGHKASSLASLMRDGHPVPDGFVVAHDDQVDAEAVAARLAALGEGPFAVRSSSVAEDLADASFAGQYTTVLGCSDTPQVIHAISEVRASALKGDAAPAGAADRPRAEDGGARPASSGCNRRGCRLLGQPGDRR